MKVIPRRIARLICTIAAISAMSACAVYGTSPAYYSGSGGVVYSPPPAVYVPPNVFASPWYVGPPVFLNFGYSTWHGRGHYRGHRGWGGHRGWHGHGHRW